MPLQRLCLLISIASSVLFAHTIQANPDTDQSIRQTYFPADFSQFVPRSALDLVKQVPGFNLDEGGGDRGFGQADTNVLINGRRVSGKSNGRRKR